MEIINFIRRAYFTDPRGAIAGWIVTLGAVWVYTPLFLIVFIETGLVFFPFLPGDSLLFAAGVFSADGGEGLNLGATLLVFYAAAILGNTSNYWIARFFGARIIDSGKIKALTPRAYGEARSLLRKVRWAYYRDYALHAVLPHLCPLYRWYGAYEFSVNSRCSIVSAVFPGFRCSCLVGFFFGGVPFVQEHFEIIVLGIVAVSVAPAFIGAVKAAISSRKSGKRDFEVEAAVDAERIARAKHARSEEEAR